MIGRRVVKIRGKETTFHSRVLKSGEIAYYRSGKRVETYYQKRLAKGVLSGLSPQAAVGKGANDFNRNFRSKALTLTELQSLREGARTGTGQHVELEKWGATFSSQKQREKSQYYADVYVTNESMRKVGSEPSSDDACVISTLALVSTSGNEIVRKFSQGEIRRNFRNILLFTLKRYGLTLCTGSLEQDVIRFWRHA